MRLGSHIQLRSILFLLAGAVGGGALVLVLVSAMEARRASMMKRSMGDAISISRAIELYKRDHGHYPHLGEDPAVDISHAIAPTYLKIVPAGAFGNSYIFLDDRGSPVVVMLGDGGFIVKEGKVVVCHAGALRRCP
jgi:hypothetical protein